MSRPLWGDDSLLLFNDAIATASRRGSRERARATREHARTRAYRPNTRIAFSRRNFGQTSSLSGTFGMSPKMRSSERPIGQ